MKSDSAKLKELREENKRLVAQVEDMAYQLRKARRALDMLNERYSGFAEAVHLLAPHVPAPKEKGKP